MALSRQQPVDDARWKISPHRVLATRPLAWDTGQEPDGTQARAVLVLGRQVEAVTGAVRMDRRAIRLVLADVEEWVDFIRDTSSNSNNITVIIRVTIIRIVIMRHITITIITRAMDTITVHRHRLQLCKSSTRPHYALGNERSWAKATHRKPLDTMQLPERLKC